MDFARKTMMIEILSNFLPLTLHVYRSLFKRLIISVKQVVLLLVQHADFGAFARYAMQL